MLGSPLSQSPGSGLPGRRDESVAAGGAEQGEAASALGLGFKV